MLRVHGFYGHARRNDIVSGLMLLAFVAAMHLLCAMVLALPLIAIDPHHFPFAHPFAYLGRYGLFVSAAALGVFCWFYFGHVAEVRSALRVLPADRRAEPRLMRIVEEQCLAAGLLTPKVGVIETLGRNALSFGTGPRSAVLVVTRGLLNVLDDDELAAVIAHETAHIRNRDIRLIAAAGASMKSLIYLQKQNPLRIEHWKQILLCVILPPMLFLYLFAGLISMFAITLGRSAHHLVLSARDHVADAEAVRMTHFPAALVSALRKIDGCGHFDGCERFDSLLFDGFSRERLGTHPAIEERIEAITRLSGIMATEERARKDTRPTFVTAPKAAFGRRGAEAALHLEREREELLTRPGTKEETGGEWGLGAERNLFGIQPHLRLPMAMAAMFVVILFWPSGDGEGILERSLGDPAGFAERMAPMVGTATFNEMAAEEDARLIADYEERALRRAEAEAAREEERRRAAEPPAEWGG
jgi:Zn-dependent protease with chaperone function